MQNQYLIPANTKRGQLILSFLLPVDLAILLTGVFVTFSLLLIFNNYGTLVAVLCVLPFAISALLVVPLGYYHNVRVAIGDIINFYGNNRNYKWRGWCSVYESKQQQ